MVTQICEGVRCSTAKQGREVNLAFTPIKHGGHPYHHMGMRGTVIILSQGAREMLIYTMLGLWNDGCREIMMVNNHRHRGSWWTRCQEPWSKGWKSVYELPHIGPFHKG